MLHFIRDGIKQRGEGDVQVSNAGISHLFAFLVRGGVHEENVVSDVALHLPHVAGMGFSYVDDIEPNLASELCIELVERGSLPAKGWSRVASEDKNHGADATQRRELHGA